MAIIIYIYYKLLDCMLLSSSNGYSHQIMDIIIYQYIIFIL